MCITLTLTLATEVLASRWAVLCCPSRIQRASRTTPGVRRTIYLLLYDVGGLPTTGAPFWGD